MDKNRKIKNGVFDKITSHLVNKLGFTPWRVENPKLNPTEPNKKDRVLLVGADVYHKKGNESVAAVIGTLNDDFTKYSSFHSV